MGCIDRDGLAVSYIQSVYWAFGSGCVLPATGIHLAQPGPRLLPRPEEPQSRWSRAASPSTPSIRRLAVFDDGRVLSYGTMGGDGQPQILGQIFTRYADFGMGLADAVDAPRWLLRPAWGASSATLKVEDRFDPGLLRASSSFGHPVEELGKPYADALGHAGMLVKHPRNGRVEAVHDPRSDGGGAGALASRPEAVEEACAQHEHEGGRQKLEPGDGDGARGSASAGEPQSRCLDEDRERRDGAGGERRAERHGEGGGDARREEALRQGEDQDDERARAGADAGGERHARHVAPARQAARAPRAAACGRGRNRPGPRR